MCDLKSLEDFFNSSFVASLLGGVLGFLGATVGANLSNKANERNRKIESCERKIREFSAVKCEIDYLLERYWNVYGNEIVNTKEGMPIREFSLSKGEYFVVFSNNSSCVGDIKSESTREAIIKTYILAKAIIEEFEENNKIIKDLEYKKIFLDKNKNKMQNFEVGSARYEILQIESTLSCYADVIKKDNKLLTSFAHEAIYGLEHEIKELRSEMAILFS